MPSPYSLINNININNSHNIHRPHNMKNLKEQFIIIAIILTLAVIFNACTDSIAHAKTMVGNAEIPALIERKGELAKASEWQKTKEKVTELTQKIVANPTDLKARLQLATIFMSEARVTGDAYYNQATLKVLDGVLSLDPNNFEALTYKASVAMSLHQFAKAKELAVQAMKINPNNAYIYGVLVDANVEQGNYTEAVAMSDKMQVLKPSLESYSRASYLREINGDYKGAIDAMQMAVTAGLPGSESASWSQVIMGDLYVATGELDKATICYKNTLVARPNFPNAEIGLAKIAKAKKDYPTAIAHTETAIRITSEAAYISLLAELYALKGDEKKANEIKKDVIDLLEKDEKAQNDGDIVMKHNANRELAFAYLAIKNYNKALAFAKTDLALRPENIDANELVAYLLYLNNYATAALPYVEKMLKTNSQNADKLYKAGLIYTKTGNTAKGEALIEQARKINLFVFN